MTEATDKIVSEFARRLRDRKLFKCIDVRTRVEHRLACDGSAERMVRVDKVCASVEEKVKYWLATQTDLVPRVLLDQATREPYKRLQESKGPLNQIRIKTSGGDLVDLGERSRIVRAIEPFHLFRVYCSDSDHSAKEFVEKAIQEEAAND